MSSICYDIFLYVLIFIGGFMNDLFRCVSRHMCLPDLLQVFYGSHQPLNRLRTPLREFMRGRVLNDGEPTPENIDAGVDRIIQNMQEELQNAAVSVLLKSRFVFFLWPINGLL